MGVARIAVAGTLGETEVRNVFTVLCDTAIAPNVAGVSTWLTSLYDTSGLLGSLSTDLHFDRFYLEHLTPAEEWIYSAEATISLTGEAASARLPNQLAAVVIGITPSRRRAKKFIPGICNSDVVEGVLQSGIVAYLENFGDTWKDGFNDGDNDWITGVSGPTPLGFISLTGIRVDPYVGTQRRRKPGLGI